MALACSSGIGNMISHHPLAQHSNHLSWDDVHPLMHPRQLCSCCAAFCGIAAMPGWLGQQTSRESNMQTQRDVQRLAVCLQTWAQARSLLTCVPLADGPIVAAGQRPEAS